jgi:hypothetical protein
MDKIATFTKRIHQGTKVTIRGDTYEAIGAIKYVTVGEPANPYTKVFFPSHRVLVLCPADDYAYFGSCGEPLDVPVPGPERLSLQGRQYQRVVTDYQLVFEILFGDLLDMEGEVAFTDYEECSGGDGLISLGLVSRDHRRADVVASVLSDADIQVG